MVSPHVIVDSVVTIPMPLMATSVLGADTPSRLRLGGRSFVFVFTAAGGVRYKARDVPKALIACKA